MDITIKARVRKIDGLVVFPAVVVEKDLDTTALVLAFWHKGIELVVKHNQPKPRIITPV